MTTYYDKYTLILKDLCLTEESEKNIAIKFSVSESYISQIKKRIRQLKNYPRIEGGNLICYKCGQNNGKLLIHHNHETGEQIAIVCVKCNNSIMNDGLQLKQRKLDFFQDRNEKNKTEILSLRLKKETMQLLREKAKNNHCSLSRYVRDLIKKSIPTPP